MSTRTVQLPLKLAENGEQCRRCATWLADSLSAEPGIDAAHVDVGRSILSLTYDPEAAPLEAVERRARELGVELRRRFVHEVFTLTEMDCPDCAATIERAVEALPGVLAVSVNYATAKMAVEYEAERLRRDRIVAAMRSLGYDALPHEMPAGEMTTRFRIAGMDCAGCAGGIERAVETLNGVHRARVNFAAGTMVVTHEAAMPLERVFGAVDRLGYTARLEGGQAAAAMPFWRRHRRALSTLASGIALAIGAALQIVFGEGQPAVPAYLLAMVLGGYPIARAGLYAATKARSLDINVLITIAAIGAAVIGEWLEGATVVFLFSLGNLLESITADRARGAIRALVALSPREARVRRDGGEQTVPVEQVQVGDLVLVRPGERIPADGVVESGSSAVHQAPVTGEAEPVAKEPGDEVFAGTINERGYLEVRATKPFAENTLSKVIHLVEEAQAQRSPYQRFIDRFARYYTPAAIGAAALVAAVPPLLGEPFAPWLYRALVLLVLACPCALVISTPVAIVSAIATAARLGVLIKGGAYVEEAGTLSAIALDKTGTITTGRPQVVDVEPLGPATARRLIGVAAAVESRSQHPLAAAIIRHAQRQGVPIRTVDAFQSYPGGGASAGLDGQTYYVGNLRLFRELFECGVRGAECGVRSAEFLVGGPAPPQQHVASPPAARRSEAGVSASEPATPHSALRTPHPALQDVEPEMERLAAEGKTPVLVGTAERLLGIITVADQVRPGAAEAVRALRRAGVPRIVMLTGDNAGTARDVAAQIGADEYRAELLPEGKVEAVRELRARYGKVGMVGDGVNDAPALAAASVGVAMGVAGTDVALETADVALMADDLSKVGYAIGLSRATVHIMRQNVALSLLTKGAAVALGLVGLLTLWLAVLADVGVALLVTLNSMRLLRRRHVSGAVPAHVHSAPGEVPGSAPGDAGAARDHVPEHDHAHHADGEADEHEARDASGNGHAHARGAHGDGEAHDHGHISGDDRTEASPVHEHDHGHAHGRSHRH